MLDEKNLSKTYNPVAYENQIYQRWEKSGYFNPDQCLRHGLVKKNAPSYSIIMPPPNVTGNLHVGHALMLVIQDILIRFNRMRGKKVLWLPGTDHAAIATQTKVEKILKDKGTDRHKLGREKFLKQIEMYANQSHDTIINQIKKMGSSCDWSREAYTLDKTRTKAVRSAFKLMYDDGLIYRGFRIVNWCPRCHSTLADDEVEYKKEKGKLYWLKYGPFILATARPETKLGDTAVAVYPGDKRYLEMVGKKYKIPGVLGEFEITVVADKAVDPEFGTGAIKVTPAHDFTDYEIAKRNNIQIKQIINEEGKMMDNCGKYAGMTTREARQVIVADMEKMGLIDHIDDDYFHNIAICYRCGTQIEPLPSLQWFIDVNKKINKYNKSIKELSIQAVKNGVFGRSKINIMPGRFEKNYFHWLNNLRDWCVSRQIWFGHRIPVWYREQERKKTYLLDGQTEKQKGKKIEITYFVHGTTTDNENGIASGHNKVSLSAIGVEQSKMLAKLIKKQKFDLIFSSDLKRAIDSAKLAFGKRGLKIIIDKRLREIDYGRLTNKKTSQVYSLKTDHIDIAFPNGESYLEVEDRIRSFLNEIISKYPGKKIALVSHQAPQLALEVLINNKTWPQAFSEDWRNNDAWQPSWKYKLKNEIKKPWNLKIYGEDIFDAIVNNTKIIETRAGRPRNEGKFWGDFKQGDEIEFFLANEKTDEIIKLVRPVRKIVKKVVHFKTLDEMFEVYNPSCDYPGKSAEEIKKWWENHPKLDQRVRKYGVWAIELVTKGEQEIYVGLEPPQDNTNFVFLHGFYRTREIKDPFNWLNQKLNNKNNFWKILPHPDKPNLKEQMDYVLKNAKITKNTVVVGHSLGGILALKLLEKNNLKIKKLVLLASSIRPHSQEIENYNQGNRFDFEKIKNNVEEIIYFQPGTDKPERYSDQVVLAKALNAKIIKVKNSAPHFNSDECQEILDELKKIVWRQDEDTLDTWFSSGLWTFSTLAHSPEQIVIKNNNIEIKSDDFKTYHPTSVLETGYDILFFWVARMIIMTTYAVKDIPFHDVYLHGLVRDEKGRKMSKSLGNTLDPLDVCKKFGTDAVRLSLVIGNSPGNDLNLGEEKISGFRNFTNKLWNISRYIISNPNFQFSIFNSQFDKKDLTQADKWILEKMKKLIREISEDLENYRFSQAGEKLRLFTWDDLADWYIEVSKFEKTSEKNNILNFILHNLLILWHPFMPFVTETIWQHIGNKNLLMVEPWPKIIPFASFIKKEEIRNFELIKQIIVTIRNARSIYGIKPDQKIIVKIYGGNKKVFIQGQAELIKRLRTGIDQLEIKKQGEKIKHAIYITVSGIEIYLIAPDFNFNKEKERLNMKIDSQQTKIKALEVKLSNKEFIAKAPAEIIKNNRANLKLNKEELIKLKSQLSNLT